MQYKLAIVSKVDLADGRHMALVTLYPGTSACIEATRKGTVAASYIEVLEPPIELPEAYSAKGKKRIKLVMRLDPYGEDGRRMAGALYYQQVFGRSCHDDETQKGIADIIYQAMVDLYLTAETDESGFSNAGALCVGAIREACARNAATTGK